MHVLLLLFNYCSTSILVVNIYNCNSDLTHYNIFFFKCETLCIFDLKLGIIYTFLDLSTKSNQDIFVAVRVNPYINRSTPTKRNKNTTQKYYYSINLQFLKEKIANPRNYNFCMEFSCHTPKT
jgi:hypothetical protein